jgi:hypothetical protein
MRQIVEAVVQDLTVIHEISALRLSDHLRTHHAGRPDQLVQIVILNVVNESIAHLQESRAQTGSAISPFAASGAHALKGIIDPIAKLHPRILTTANHTAEAHQCAHTQMNLENNDDPRRGLPTRTRLAAMGNLYLHPPDHVLEAREEGHDMQKLTQIRMMTTTVLGPLESGLPGPPPLRVADGRAHKHETDVDGLLVSPQHGVDRLQHRKAAAPQQAAVILCLLVPRLAQPHGGRTHWFRLVLVLLSLLVLKLQ